MCGAQRKLQQTVSSAAQIWRDGAVWEFGGPVNGDNAAESTKSKEFVGSIGGSTGVKKAVNVVLAAGRFARAGANAHTDG